MRTLDHVPPSAVRRAADIARGPHACPSCECPTFTEPPVPWTELRDYVVRCDACDRPIAVTVDRQRILRRHPAPRAVSGRGTTADRVEELLESRGVAAFTRRTVLAALLPVLVAATVLTIGDGPETRTAAVLLAISAITPGALWGPAAAVMLRDAVAAWLGRQRSALAARLRRAPRQAALIEVRRGRWDQWLREQKQRAADREQQPDAVLRELERVLDDRELRRVRALADRGEVPAEHLDDLLHHRRSFARIA